MSDPYKFSEVRPPQMKISDDVYPATPSAGLSVGTFTITSKDFDNVIDAKYDYKKYEASLPNPDAAAKIAEIKKNRLAEVKEYTVERSRYWARQQVWQYAEDTEVTVTQQTGCTTHDIETHDKTLTESISYGLNLSFSGGEVGDLPIPPVALAAVGGGPDIGAHFSHEFSTTLHFSSTHEITYSKETSVQTRVTFRGNYLYLMWNLVDELKLSRKSTDGSVDVLSTMAGNQTAQTQALNLTTSALSEREAEGASCLRA